MTNNSTPAKNVEDKSLNLENFVYRTPRRMQVYVVLRSCKNVFRGVLKYFLKHPIKCWKIFYYRAAFALWRGSIKGKKIVTPEGIILERDVELIIHNCFFVEQNLFYRPMVKELKLLKLFRQSFNIIDVGANVGFFSQWIGTYYPYGNFSCVEIWDKNVKRGQEINKDSKLTMTWYNNAAHNKSNVELTFNIGNLTTLKDTPNIQATAKINSITIDSITDKMTSIFAMKIDTDGNNVNILEGSRETLHKTKWLLIEEEPGVRDWMELNAPGFRLMKWTSPDDLIYRNTYIV